MKTSISTDMYGMKLIATNVYTVLCLNYATLIPSGN